MCHVVSQGRIYAIVDEKALRGLVHDAGNIVVRLDRKDTEFRVGPLMVEIKADWLIG